MSSNSSAISRRACAGLGIASNVSSNRRYTPLKASDPGELMSAVNAGRTRSLKAIVRVMSDRASAKDTSPLS